MKSGCAAQSSSALLRAKCPLVQVGDFGVIDKKTGEFEYHGNVYTDEEILEDVPALAAPFRLSSCHFTRRLVCNIRLLFPSLEATEGLYPYRWSKR